MSDLPLRGVRIVDFSWMGVGPYCTMLCSWMGAECIKIESSTRPGVYRGPDLNLLETQTGTPRNSMNELNVNKLSACINLKHEDGIQLVKQLIAKSDVVAENFRSGVIDRLGLGYSELRKVNPSVILVSMSAHGAFGPETGGRGLAAIFGALAGASHMTGYEDGPPVELRLPADLISGTTFCFALLSALHHAKKTGAGMWIDCSSREVVSSFVGEALLDAMVNGHDQPRRGNRDTIMAPHNVYPCVEPDRWISIAVANREEWEALCNAAGLEEWLNDDRFTDQLLRWKNQDTIDARLEEWSRQLTAEDAMTVLQEAGVPATASYSVQDLLADPHLHDRGVFEEAAEENGKPYIMMGLPWKLSQTVPEPPSRPPEMGEQNHYVFQELLGMGDNEVQDLVSRGVID